MDRSATYAGRYVAKNMVASGLADKCEIQVSYAIGVAEPTSITIDTFGTGKVDDRKIDGLCPRGVRPAPVGPDPDAGPAASDLQARPPPTATSAARTPTPLGAHRQGRGTQVDGRPLRRLPEIRKRNIHPAEERCSGTVRLSRMFHETRIRRSSRPNEKLIHECCDDAKKTTTTSSRTSISPSSAARKLRLPRPRCPVWSRPAKSSRPPSR